MPTTTKSLVDTKHVTDRRSVHYDSYDDLLADAESLAHREVRTVGNWTFAQILDHMAKACHGMIDGMNFKLPAPARFMMRLLMKKKMLSQTLKPGFQIPNSVKSDVEPIDISVEEGLAGLREAIERCKSETKRSPHPAFGHFTREEWDQFQLRHCEMHMSFVLPVESVS